MCLRRSGIRATPPCVRRTLCCGWRLLSTTFASTVAFLCVGRGARWRVPSRWMTGSCRRRRSSSVSSIWLFGTCPSCCVSTTRESERSWRRGRPRTSCRSSRCSTRPASAHLLGPRGQVSMPFHAPCAVMGLDRATPRCGVGGTFSGFTTLVGFGLTSE